jgi:mannitol/fructose-specific phosphotransferase system IIA component (Ntr-type)
MSLTQLLDPRLVQMHLETEPPEPEEGAAELAPGQVRDFKEAVLAELAEIFERSERVSNPSRLLRDLVNRERKASTALGRGVAFPHVHSLQARDLIVAVALAPEGIPFDAPDRELVRLIVGIVAPRDNDRLYLNLVRRFSEMFLGDVALPEVLAARDEYEVVRVLGGYL